MSCIFMLMKTFYSSIVASYHGIRLASYILQCGIGESGTIKSHEAEALWKKRGAPWHVLMYSTG